MRPTRAARSRSGVAAAAARGGAPSAAVVAGTALAVVLAALLGLAAHPAPAAGQVGSAKVHPALQRAAAGEDSLYVWVWLADRGVSGSELRRALTRTRQTLTVRALDRRARRGRITGVDPSDLPVHPDYLTGLQAAGLRLRRTSRWLNAVSGVLHPDDLEGVAALAWVERVTPLGRGGSGQEPDPSLVADLGRGAGPVPTGTPGAFFPARAASTADALQTGPTHYGLAWEQNLSLQVPDLHLAGYRGEGMLIGLMDTGFDSTHVVFASILDEGRLLGQYDFIDDDGVVANEVGDPLTQHNHGTQTWSVIGGYWPGTGRLVGVAPEASFLLAKTEDVASETPVEEDNWIAAIEWMEALGVDVTNTSLSYLDWYSWRDMDGETAPITIAADAAAARGVVVVSSAGNDGGGFPPASPDTVPLTYYVGAPADGDSVIAVGATDASGTLAPFSSHGPTFDGRRKPDLVARGIGVAVAVPTTSDTTLGTSSGTSYSSPLTAGTAALVLQANPDWDPAELLAALRATADRSSNNVPGQPDNDYGWGYVQGFDAAAYEIGPVQPGTRLGFYNHPNPFPGGMGEGTSFRCDLPGTGSGSIRIFTRTGTLVRVLEVATLTAAVVEVAWDGRNSDGRSVAPGAYLAVLEFAGERAVITVLKVR